MSDDERKMMRIAGYLHDIGKLKIPDEILEKPGKLTDEEFNATKAHTCYSWIIFKDIQGFEQIASWAALLHEKLNGNKYLFHFPGSELTLGSRIMTDAAIISALTEDRPYRGSMDIEKVMDILRENARNGLMSRPIAALLIGLYDAINGRQIIRRVPAPGSLE